MESNHAKLGTGKIAVSSMARFSAICFFCNPFITLIYRAALSRISLTSLTSSFTLITIYIPFLLACIVQPRKYIKADVIFLFFFVFAFFGLTLLLHPEYEYWYARPDYGVWPYVLFPTNAMYGYLFVRLYDDPAKLKADIKVSGWIMYLYFFYQIISALARGYWSGVAGDNGEAELSYSVSFGYNVIFFTLPFLHDAIHKKKATDILTSVVGLMMVITYGSRGPAMCIAIFLVLEVVMEFKQMKNSPQKMICFICGAVLFILLYIFYDALFALLIDILMRTNSSSRLIAKLLNGTIASDSGRSVIWNAAVQMLKDNPWGYGAMGSQHVISSYIYAGYPHSIILELMIDFGVIGGGILFVFLICHSFSILFRKKYSLWAGTFLPFFCTACSLFLSLCYWSNKAFWVCLGIGVNAHYILKSSKAKNLLDKGQEP